MQSNEAGKRDTICDPRVPLLLVVTFSAPSAPCLTKVACLLPTVTWWDAISSNQSTRVQSVLCTNLYYSLVLCMCTRISTTLLCRVRFKINIYKRTSGWFPARFVASRRTWARRRTIVCFRYNNDFRRLRGACSRQAGSEICFRRIMLCWFDVLNEASACRCSWLWTLEQENPPEDLSRGLSVWWKAEHVPCNWIWFVSYRGFTPW